jgi:DNA (cytosine-5)-methyltransferase 1
MRSVELFTGAGGLALGLEKAGFRSALMVEWDDHAHETIQSNSAAGGATFGWPIHHGDVRDVSFGTLGTVDLVAGGPPCQPFSIGGKHRGPDDPRDMWPQAIRAVRELAPRAFLFENVRGLARAAFSEYLRYILERLQRPAMTARPGETWQRHLSRLARLSPSDGDGPLYRVEVHKINAADYGAAQKRHRVIVVGIRADLDIDWQFPCPTHSSDALVWDQWVTGEYWRRHRVATRDRPSLTKVERRFAARLDDQFAAPAPKPWVTVRDVIGDLPNPEKLRESPFLNHRFQPGARAYAGHTGSPLDAPAKALKAGDHGVPGGENMLMRLDGTVRYFTVRESARLQGFPDHFHFPGSWSETMRQLGNAVPVPMALAIASSIGEALSRAEERLKGRRAA